MNTLHRFFFITIEKKNFKNIFLAQNHVDQSNCSRNRTSYGFDVQQ